MNDIIQAIILISAALAIGLIARGERQKRPSIKLCGSAIGLLGQPFWLISSWQSGAWGIFLLTWFFAWSYFEIARANWGCEA